MRIDLHCHTKKVKSGDAETRNVTKEIFVKNLLDSQVKFVAITNHNHFDYEQYLDFSAEAIPEEITVWPGIELDVRAKKSKGHIIVICDPREVDDFAKLCNEIIGDVSADDFIIEVDDFINKFLQHNAIIIAHHYLKSEGFVDYDLDYIRDKLQNTLPFLLEPSSLKSVGIMYAHGYNAFIGSDVSDWNKYSNKKLPELKMDISNFSTFILLLKKDPQVIKTFLSQKPMEKIKIQPFSAEKDLEEIEIPIYNDLNIIFGGKGTGKSMILEAIREHYLDEGDTGIAYYTGQTKESEYKKIIKRTMKPELFELLRINKCEEEFERINAWKEPSLITTSSYFKGIQSKNNGGNFKKLGFSRANFSEVISNKEYQNSLDEYTKIVNSLNSFKEVDIKKHITVDENDSLNFILDKILNSFLNKMKKEWISMNALKLEKFTIEKIQNIALAKTGNFSIPPTTGLIDLYQNVLQIHKDSKKIYSSMSKTKENNKELIGEIIDKGRIYVKTEVYINPTEGVSIYYDSSKPQATTLKKIFKTIKTIYDNSFLANNAANIAEFNSECSNNCKSLIDCFGIKSFVCKEDGTPYSPSGGEASMLLLNNSLIDDNKSIYILDEPELSVGHKYINEIIVPRLKELSKMNLIAPLTRE